MLFPLVLLSMACTPDATPEFCTSRMEHRYDVGSDELLAFPDDAWTTPDPASPTGLRVATADAPWMSDVPELLAGSFDALDGATGFGRLGAAVLRFTGDLGEVPASAEASVSDPGLQWLDLDADPPERVPFRATLTDEGEQLELQPLRPLASGARHAIVLTTAHQAASGTCVAPSPQQRALLSGDDDGPMAERYAELLDLTGLHADEVSAALLFTAHDDVHDLATAAEDVRTHTYSWETRPGCTSGRCENSFVASDYRDETGLVGPVPAASWTLPVTIWLPSTEPPHPVIVFGHGINSSRGEGGGAASRLGDLGFAVVAVDAMEHNDHPTAADDTTMDAMAFLGIDLSSLSIDSIASRSNFDQTILDRLQLLELLEQDPDVDDDGVADLDPTRMVYLGISLGGLLGPALLSLSDDLHAAVLPTSGGHLMTFATESDNVAGVGPLLESVAGGEAELRRVLALGQASMDASDPAVWGSHVLTERLYAEEHLPHVLVPVALLDNVVPGESGRALARGLRVPHLPPVADPVDGLEVGGALPIAANLDGVTAGYFQYDRVTEGDEVVSAEHWNTVWSPEATLQMREFLSTWLEDGVPTVLDPYDELGTPPL